MSKFVFSTSIDNLSKLVIKSDKHFLLPVVNRWADECSQEGVIQYPVLLGMFVYAEGQGENVNTKQALIETIYNDVACMVCYSMESWLLVNPIIECFDRHSRTLKGAYNCSHQEIVSSCSFALEITKNLKKSNSRVLRKDTTLYCNEARFKRIACSWACESPGCVDFTKWKRRGHFGSYLFFAE